MLTIACVNQGTKYKKEYVEILEQQVKRNTRIPHEFVCLTDKPKNYKCKTINLPKGLEGWWAKTYLFKAGLFPDRVLYFDLDVCITGSLDCVAEIESKFCIIQDWHLPMFNSSCMVIDKAHPEVWDDFDYSTRHEWTGGDQHWITHKVPNAATFPAEWFVSYRSHAIISPPKGSKCIVFHGEPKPDKYPSEWVRDYWTTRKNTRNTRGDNHHVSRL